MSFSMISLDFFDIPVELSVSAEDACDARWFFSRHLRPGQARLPDAGAGQDAQIRVSCSPGLFASLLDHTQAEKSLSMHDEDGLRTVRFTAWSNAPSFLPPFASESFTKRYAILHGSAVVAPNGRALILLGRNYIGKTATSLELLRRGWSLVSDSCVVLDFDDPARPVLRRYETPFGFRRATLTKWSELLAQVDSREQVSRDTGPVVLAHVSDVIADLECQDRIPVSVVVCLDDGTDASKPGNAASVLRVYPGRTRAQVAEALKQLPRHIIFEAGHADIARLADELEHVAMSEPSAGISGSER
jgi:hypothetical protein